MVKIRSKPNPFITPEIRQLMRTRDQWRKLASKTKDPLHWNGYKFFRQEVKREIRIAEKAYVRLKFWRVKEILTLSGKSFIVVRFVRIKMAPWVLKISLA